MERRTFYAKPGSLTKMIELCKESATFVELPYGFVLYTNFAGEFNVVMADMKFENLAELEELWKELVAHPDWPELIERWNEVVARSGKREILNLVE